MEDKGVCPKCLFKVHKPYKEFTKEVQEIKDKSKFKLMNISYYECPVCYNSWAEFEDVN